MCIVNSHHSPMSYAYAAIFVVQLSRPTNRTAHALASPKQLRDSYFAGLPGSKIKVLDVCYASGQHYSEWKRWLRGAIKVGSTADRAFRDILSSGKRPLEFKRKPRPIGWR